MTTENTEASPRFRPEGGKETEFDKREIRPMIQFVPGKQDTTESRLTDVREQMTFTRAKKTIRRSGWYFTEPCAPCGEHSSICDEHISMEEIKASISSVFGA